MLNLSPFEVLKNEPGASIALADEEEDEETEDEDAVAEARGKAGRAARTASKGRRSLLDRLRNKQDDEVIDLGDAEDAAHARMRSVRVATLVG